MCATTCLTPSGLLAGSPLAVGPSAVGPHAANPPAGSSSARHLLGLLPLLGAAVAMARATAGNTASVEPSDLLAQASDARGEELAGPRGEDDLVRRARRGEREAFGLIYDQHADLVFRYAYYRVGGNRAVAEDVVSETFLRALTRISSFEWQGREIGAWLITIARNHIVDLARSGRARLEFPTADLLATADERVGSGTVVPGPEDTVLSAIELRELLQALSSLGAEQRECVTLRFLQGLSVRETALAMNKKEGAVRALQLRAVRTLARQLPAPRGD
ncbi:RNA polymerase sigma-70 factor, ECF subfamily [Parafrankia irregularis]|uniref:RNA polymerase sigma-70 factor, ECF subfamily n=1 Tax=Parafrankia irregularis TaxID=795642 RepID=A0A0S4QG53_9ACTN|nr:sigma-70 family RNA polymerase sigma factor [Parafrankia irregularis]CUU54217.1 RNA polymerase sigma-70 factor, ECF subfamily [Parafrankia irregularis]